MSTIRPGNLNAFCREAGLGGERHLGQKAGHEACFQVRFLWLLDGSDNSWLCQGKEKTGKLVGLSGIIQKQGVGFPEMEKKWFGGPQHLNPHMYRPGSLLHESGASPGTRCPLGGTLCAWKRWRGGHDSSLTEDNPRYPSFSSTPHVVTLLPSRHGSPPPQLDFIPAHYMHVGNLSASAGSMISTASCRCAPPVPTGSNSIGSLGLS